MLQLVIESWIWYAVAISITICRFVSRLLLLKSPRNLLADDWIILGAVCTYTTFLVTINIVADQSSNLLPPGFDVDTLTPKDVKHREYGSKLVLVVEQMQCVTIWTLKAALLILYYRLTMAMRQQNLAVKVLAVYIAVGFIVMEVLYFAVWCRPFHEYWAVPSDNSQCTAATNHLITNAVFNISSDLILLSIGISMFFQSRLPWKRKLILYGVFSVGIFVILSAVMNKYYSFTQPFGDAWTNWYVRESSTAFIVANIPYTWTLLRRVFHLKAFHAEDNSSVDRSVPFHSARSARGRHSARSSNSHNGTANRTNLLSTRRSAHDSQTSRTACLESRETRKESQTSSNASASEDLEAGRTSQSFSPTAFVRLPVDYSAHKHARQKSGYGPVRPPLRVESWDPENEFGSPVELPGRALYYESSRNVKTHDGRISPVAL